MLQAMECVGQFDGLRTREEEDGAPFLGSRGDNNRVRARKGERKRKSEGEREGKISKAERLWFFIVGDGNSNEFSP